MQFLPPNSGARRANGQKYAPGQAAEREEGWCFFGVLFLWLTIGYIKYCSSGHVSVIISQVMKEVGRAHRRKLRLSESWSFLSIPQTPEKKLITQQHPELTAIHSSKSHLQATASPQLNETPAVIDSALTSSTRQN